MSEPEAIDFGRAFGKIYLLLADAYSQAEGAALTVNQRLAIGAIADFGPLGLSRLATLIGTSAPTASRVVDGLVDVGYVTRRADQDDRRAVRLELTRRGRARVERSRARVGARIEHAVAHLAEQDRLRLLTLLGEVAAGLGPPVRGDEVLATAAEAAV
jgi:DNA-binding MarR family transcriptional regulator